MDSAVQPWMRSAVPQGLPSIERTSRMRVGLSEVFWGENDREFDFLRKASVLIERLGYDTIWLPEHVVTFETITSRHPYAGSRLQTGWEHKTRGQFDSPTTAVAIALLTTTIRIGTYVNLLGLRNPVLFAREVATIDHLTNGRFDLGIGVGWSRQEYEALGVPFERRGDRVDEYVNAMKRLWLQEQSEFHGDFVDFGPLLAFPKPLQRPHPPVIVAGQSKRGIRRAADLGDGLIVYNLNIPEVGLCLEEYDRQLQKRGRRLEDMSVVAGRRNVAGDAFSFDKPADQRELREIWEADAQFLEECRGLGAITEAVFSPRLPTDGYSDLMELYATTLGVC